MVILAVCCFGFCEQRQKKKKNLKPFVNDMTGECQQLNQCHRTSATYLKHFYSHLTLPFLFSLQKLSSEWWQLLYCSMSPWSASNSACPSSDHLQFLTFWSSSFLDLVSRSSSQRLPSKQDRQCRRHLL